MHAYSSLSFASFDVKRSLEALFTLSAPSEINND